MAFPNMQLRALVGSLVAYAESQGWSVAEVEATFHSMMEPLRKREEAASLARLAERLTLKEAEDAVSYAMSDFWDEDKMTQLFAALTLRFPKRAKTVVNIDDWAGEACNEIHESCPDEDLAARLYNKALKALRSLPWPATVEVNQ